jgi:hypothetical protein
MIELHITWDEATGNVNVNGPVHNKGLCYMMLECAKDAVRSHCDQMQKSSELTDVNNGLESIIRKRIDRPKR